MNPAIVRQSVLVNAPEIHVTSKCVGDTWDGFVRAHPHGGVEHLSDWQTIFSGVFGHQPIYLTALRGDRPVGVLPLVAFKSMIFGRSLISLPYTSYAGLLSTEPAASAALVSAALSAARDFGANHVELRGIDRQLDTVPFRSHKVGARLDLPATSEAMWTRLDRKLRNQVRKAQKEKLTVFEGGDELVPEFYRVFRKNMRDLGTPVFPRGLFEYALRLGSVDARVHIVRLNETAVAGGLSLGWRDTILVPWASSLREYRHLCGNVLLYWSMIERAVERGYQRFDFGRSTPGGGTHNFKTQWGADDFPLHWEYPLLPASGIPDAGPSNPRLQAFIAAWRRLPLPVASALGPVITRHLPG
jgi:FemAB-related protein (PEP-CTERM system-associated)